MEFIASSKPKGQLMVRKWNEVIAAPLLWILMNTLRWGFIKGWIAYHIVAPMANAWGVATMMGMLGLRKRAWYDDMERQHYVNLRRQCRLEEAEEYAKSRTYWIDYGIVSYRVVTDSGVAYIVDDLDNAAGGADISNFNFHGVGTGNTAEAVGDTALVTESTTALNPDSTRATGTRTQPAANQYRSTGTLTFDAPAAVVEHGLFTQAATGGGTLLDRSVFAAVNVASGETLQTQYTYTVNSGG
jgi:hypothetical protein